MILFGMPSTIADGAGSPDGKPRPLTLLKTISRARGAYGWEPRGPLASPNRWPVVLTPQDYRMTGRRPGGLPHG